MGSKVVGDRFGLEARRVEMCPCRVRHDQDILWAEGALAILPGFLKFRDKSVIMRNCLIRYTGQR